MSVAVGLDPALLAELDWPMFEAVERAAAERWTPLESMLADLLELEHAHYVAYLATHTKKGSKLPPPLRVTRPGADGYPEPTKLSPLAFATQFGPTEAASG